MNTNPLLNPETLESLRQLDDPGSNAFVTGVVDAYLADTEKRLQAMREAHRAGNAASLASLAHAVKGSSLNLGADRLAGRMQALEGDCHHGMAIPAERLAEIEGLFSQVREGLLAFRG